MDDFDIELGNDFGEYSVDIWLEDNIEVSYIHTLIVVRGLILSEERIICDNYTHDAVLGRMVILLFDRDREVIV